MAIHGFPGGVISATPPTISPSGASGVWTLDEQLQAGANWPVAPSFVNNSVRLRASASAYLRRTPTVSSDRRTWTFSCWFKRGSLATGAQQALLSVSDGTSFPVTGILITDADRLRIASGTALVSDIEVSSTQVFRDPSAWYHLVVAIDTTQATSTNRVRAWVNNVQVALNIDNTLPAQNYQTMVNNAGFTHNIGAQSLNGLQRYFDGYITDVNFIDGQALTPNYFGAVDGATGVWEPATYRGTYGTNGFYLPFRLNTTPTFGVFAADLGASFNTLPTGSQGSNFQFTGNFTIEGWVLYPSASTGDGSVYVSSDGSGFLAFNVDMSAGVYNIYMNSGTPTAVISHGIQAGIWTHVAMVRNGSTVTLYTNGVSRGTFTNSSTVGYSTLTLNRFGGGASGQRFLSNVRAVKAAVYTSAFTPPTSPLTSIANTLFLTYQNSTAIDNGPNAFALGTTGTLTFSTQYPFTLNIASDQSGNGNNWTTNNISLANNSTFDSMTDVPTLTSATASNFAVFNPLAKRRDVATNVTFANGNLQATFNDAGGNTTHAWGTIYPTAGKYYWEITVANNASNLAIGIGSQPDQEGTANTSVIYVAGGGIFRYGVSQTTAASYTTNDIIGVAYDVDSATVAFYKNNSLQFTVTGLTVIPSGSFNRGSTNDSLIANFGQRPFAYTPPSGFVALNTFNLPTPTIGATASTQANKYMNVVTYSGTGSTRTVTGVGFQPDFLWIKNRSAATDNYLYDVIRGAGNGLYSNLTSQEVFESNQMSAFASDGFTVNTAQATNGNTNALVAWNWKANGTGVTNTAGSITSTVSANTTSGFSVVTYTGNGSNGATIGHGLGVAPSWVIVKRRNSSGDDWLHYHISLGATRSIAFDTAAAITSSTRWNNTTPSSTVVTLGTSTGVNASGGTYVAYCFSEVAGYSRFGAYTGNGSSDGPFIFTGFRPRYVMIKRTDSGNNWFVLDTARDTFNLANDQLLPNSAAAESTNTDCNIDMVSNGFKLRTALDASNGSGGTYIYAAFAETPLKFSNAR